ncbi:MAG: GAF domain-containing protein [Chloroflexi bacterium]|nr:GAF domain-containing protein [Chloroflexota bacterium]
MINPQLSAEEVQELTQSLGQSALSLSHSLRQQEYDLRKLGVGLPAKATHRLETVHTELQALATRVEEQITELAQLRTLANTTELINSSLDLDTVLNEVMDQVIRLTGAERGYIMLRDPHTGELNPRVVRMLEMSNSEEFIVSETVVDRVIEQGETVITTNAQEDSRFMSQESIIGFALRSIICVPLMTRDKIIGAVYCDNRIRDALFGNREKRLLTGFANQAAIAIENAQFFEQIKQALAEITEIKVLLDNILASIVSAVITTDAEGRITTYNQAAELIFGVPATEAVSHWLDEKLPMLYPHLRDSLDVVVNQDITTTFEAEISMGDQGIRYFNVKVSPLRDVLDETRSVGLALVVDDVTDLKQRNATLAAVRRYLPPAMVDNIKSIERLALGGERRTVTVLFVEVRPFATFPKSLAPRELMEWLNTYHTIGSEAIHHHKGLIDKYMGNEIMSIFNSQLNPSDTHPWDAVQAALRMAADFRTMAMFGKLEGDISDQPFYRIGIHTGIATMGNVGSRDRREFSAIGDTVNLSHRLMENCELAQIIISQETLSACRDAIEATEWIGIRELESIQVKGRVQPARIYEIYDTGV